MRTELRMRDVPGRATLAGLAIRTLRLFPRRELTFFLGQHGRLGNQLFQVASTYALASDLGVQIVLRRDWPYRPYFSVPEEWFAGRAAVLRCRKSIDYATRLEPEHREYLQDLALWGGREEEIRRLLQPSRRALAEAKTRYRDLLALPSKTMVHVRRGDYLLPHMPFQLCTVDYYREAVELVVSADPDTRLVVFSDDIEWCRRNLPFSDAIYVDGNPDWLDLTLMSRCEHHICANSTFSWWGAFLSLDPSPIVPWMPETLSAIFARIYPPSWRRLPVNS